MTINFINNIGMFKNISPVKNRINTLVSFKAGLQKDVVELSKKTSMPSDLQTKMQSDVQQLYKMKLQLSDLSSEIVALRLKDLQLEYDYKQSSKKDSKRVSFSTSTKELEFRESRNKLIQKTQEERELLFQVNRMQNTVRQWEVCEQMYEKGDKFASLYQPNLTIAQREKIAESMDNITTAKTLESYAHITKQVVSSWIGSGVIEARKFGNDESLKLIDLDIQKNQEFLDGIRERMQYSVPARTVYESTGYQEKEFNNVLKHSGFKLLGYPIDVAPMDMDSALIDMEDKRTQKTLKEKHKCVPFPSKRFYRPKGQKSLLVPAKYLESLGYGRVKQLRNMVENGFIKGKIRFIDTQEGRKVSTHIDIGENATSELKLENIRRENKAIENVLNITKRLEVPMITLENAMQSGELEIVPSYIFENDKGVVLIDKRRQKNRDFMERITLESAIKEVVRDMSNSKMQDNKSMSAISNPKLKTLKMQLIWLMCPQIKQLAYETAMQNPKLVSIFNKTGEEAPLNHQEQIELDKYHNQIWNETTKQEFSNAQNMALQLMHDYEAYGIESIGNKQVRKVIKHFYS